MIYKGEMIMTVTYDTPTKPAPESHKIHSGRYSHDRLPARPCADTPAWHLRNNNLLGLQAVFQCGTIHHHCTGVTLRKAGDAVPSHADDHNGHRVYLYLARQWSGPLSNQSWDDLQRNDLRGLWNLFYLQANDPTPGR